MKIPFRIFTGLFAFLVLFFFLMLSSTTSICQVEINLDLALKKKAECKLSKIAIDIEFIKLETSIESSFYYPQDVHLIGDRIYFFDKKISQFFIFTLEGKFVRKFGNKGKGPNEFISVQDFLFDKYSNEFIVLTREKKMLKFDLDGNLIGSLSLPSNPYSLAVNKSNFIAYYPVPTCIENEGCKLSVIDRNGKHVKRFEKNRDCGTRDVILFNSFFMIDDNLRFWECVDNTMYNVDVNLNITQAYSFSSKRLMPKEDYSSLARFQAGVHNYITIQKLMEADRFLFIKGRSRSYGTGMFVVYDKSTHSCISLQDEDLEKIGFRDDLTSPMYFWPMQILNDGRAICVVEIMDLKARFKDSLINEENCVFPSKYTALKRIVENSSIDDNPMLFLITLKRLGDE